MTGHTSTVMLIAMLTLASACATGEGPGDAAGAPVDPETAPAESDSSLPAASVLIAHRVADYDAWKLVFDGHAQARKEASCLGHYLKRGIDFPDTVYVYCLATDADKLRTFLGSVDLVETMRKAGVEGEPEITLMKPMSRDLVAKRKLPGIIVMHSVKDYETWRVAYDEFDGFRRQSGIVGHAVTQEFGNPNRVIVYHQADDVNLLRAFVESAELREVMQRAGVVGDPDIRFIQVVDFADY